MSTLKIKYDPSATDVTCTDTSLQVTLSDGREVSAPLEWFPRLRNATSRQRSKWRLIGGGIGIHWPELDEDISVESLLFINPPVILGPFLALDSKKGKHHPKS